MSARDAKRCRHRAEELRATPALMTGQDCRRIPKKLAAEYEAVAEQWETISALTSGAGGQMKCIRRIHSAPDDMPGRPVD
jgi:hypothetical protein